MPELRRIPVIAIILLVALRMSIGWQMFYEGLWKFDTLDSTEPWTSEGYLKNAVGPFRGVFRDMTGDPDDLLWLDYDAVAKRWDNWHARFLAQYPDLTDEQKRKLDQLINGHNEYSAELTELPAGVKFERGLEKIVRYDAEKKRLIVDGRMHLLPAERERILEMVSVKAGTEVEGAPAEQNKQVEEFRKAVTRLYDLSQKGMGYKERLMASLKGDPTRAGKLIVNDEKETVEELMGDIRLYKEQLERYKKNEAAQKTNFQKEHLKRQWAELQELRSRVVGPIKGLDAELKKDARELLTTSQLAYGPVPDRVAPVTRIDDMTMWSLTILGMLLIVGLFSRLACVGAAGLLLMFYLAMPPWPGVTEIAGTEHALIINKNLIEVVALLGLACMPTGAWFGIDSIFYGWWVRRRANAELNETNGLATSSPGRAAPSPTVG